MSVFTTVTPEQLSIWLKHYTIGKLIDLQGISSGIENTNYYVTTTCGRYVLTLFEKLDPGEIPVFLGLMAHLARHGIPSPQPVANSEGDYLGNLNGKPASIVTCVPGAEVEFVTVEQCAIIGELLAQMHLASSSYHADMPNPRGPAWWEAMQPGVLPFLDQNAGTLLKQEVRFSRQRFDRLPRGIIHADLFRDNVLWDGERVGGIIDFYFACSDFLLYDIAIAVNDWCVTSDAGLDRQRAAALLGAYHRQRPFSEIEFDAWPAMLRAAALRFWISRLHDLHRPRQGELTYTKDPRHFRRILEQHIAQQSELRSLVVS